MDSLGYHIVVVLPPLDIRLLRVELLPTAGPKQSAVAQLTVTRELSIMSVGSQLTVQHDANVSFKCHSCSVQTWHRRRRLNTGHTAVQRAAVLSVKQMGCCACGAGHCASSPALQRGVRIDSGRGGQQPEPRHCVLLRASGVMSVLDLDHGGQQCVSTQILLLTWGMRKVLRMASRISVSC